MEYKMDNRPYYVAAYINRVRNIKNSLFMAYLKRNFRLYENQAISFEWYAIHSPTCEDHVIALRHWYESMYPENTATFIKNANYIIGNTSDDTKEAYTIYLEKRKLLSSKDYNQSTRKFA